MTAPNRRDLYAVIACTTPPTPKSVDLFERDADPNTDLFGLSLGFGDLRLSRNAPGQVDAWAAAYGTARPAYGEVVRPDGPNPWRTYKVRLRIAGWEMDVSALVDLDVVPVDEPDVACTLCHPEPCSVPDHSLVDEPGGAS